MLQGSGLTFNSRHFGNRTRGKKLEPPDLSPCRLKRTLAGFVWCVTWIVCRMFSSQPTWPKIGGQESLTPACRFSFHGNEVDAECWREELSNCTELMSITLFMEPLNDLIV